MAADVLLSVTTLDYNGHTKQTLIFFANGTTLADVTAYAASYRALHEAVSQGRVTKALVTFDVTPAPTANALPVVRVNEAARLSFATPGRYKFGAYIPVINPSLVLDTEIDITDADVIALAGAFTAGLGGVVPTNGHGEDVGALVAGKFSLLK